MNRLARGIACCMLSASALLTACQGDRPESLIASAKGYIAKHDYKAASIQLKTALQKEPSSSEARLLLGSVLLDAGDATSAIVELRKAIALNHPRAQVIPVLARAMLLKGQLQPLVTEFAATDLGDGAATADLKTSLALAYARQGKGKEAQAALESALRSSSTSARARGLQARFKAEAGDFDGALALLNEILAKAPDNVDAWQLKGDLLYVVKKDVAGALDAHRNALKARPDLAASHASILSILVTQKDLAGAKRQLDELKKVAPNHLETKYFEAELALLNQDFKTAKEISQQLLKVAPENVKILQLAGAVEYQSGSILQAKHLLGRALQIAPNMTATRRLLARAYLRSGQPSEALDQLAPLLQAAEPGAETLALAAEAYLHNGDPANAEAYFERAAKLNPNDTRSRTALALGQLSRGNTEAGFSQLEEIAASDKGTVADQAMIASRLGQNDYAGALKAIEGFERKRPNTALAANLRGRIQLTQKDLPGARQSFERALAIDPLYQPAVVSLVAMDLAEKKPEQARKRYDAILRADPGNLQALLAIAGLRADAGASKEEVIGLLANAVRLNPTQVAPRLLLIDAQMRNKDLKAALSVAQDGVAALPDSPDMHDALGRVQLASGDFNQAIASFKKTADLQPRSVAPQLRLAELYVKTKNTDAARQSLKRALAITPDLVTAQRDLIMLELGAGHADEALALAQQVQKRAGHEAVGLMLVGDVEAARKRWDAAAAAYRSGLKQSNASEFAIKLHVVMQSSRQEAGAERFAASWLKDHPKDAVFLTHLGNTALSQGKFAAAESHYLAVVGLQPDNPVALNNLAWVTQRLNKPGALAYAEKATTLQPNQPAFMDTLAMILGNKGELNKALEIEKKAVALQPDQPGVRLNLAKLYIKAGQGALAKTELKQLARLGSKFAGQAEVGELLKSL